MCHYGIVLECCINIGLYAVIESELFSCVYFMLIARDLHLLLKGDEHFLFKFFVLIIISKFY